MKGSLDRTSISCKKKCLRKYFKSTLSKSTRQNISEINYLNMFKKNFFKLKSKSQLFKNPTKRARNLYLNTRQPKAIQQTKFVVLSIFYTSRCHVRCTSFVVSVFLLMSKL